MPELNLRKPHVEFGGGEGMRPVVLQNGCCFAHDGTLLPSDPQQLAARGFAVPKDLRKTLLLEKHKRDAELEMERIRRDMEVRHKEEMSRLEDRLSRVSEMGDEALDTELQDLLSVVEDPEELNSVVPEAVAEADEKKTRRGSSIKVATGKKK